MGFLGLRHYNTKQTRENISGKLFKIKVEYTESGHY